MVSGCHISIRNHIASSNNLSGVGRYYPPCGNAFAYPKIAGESRCVRKDCCHPPLYIPRANRTLVNCNRQICTLYQKIPNRKSNLIDTV